MSRQPFVLAAAGGARSEIDELVAVCPRCEDVAIEGGQELILQLIRGGSMKLVPAAEEPKATDQLAEENRTRLVRGGRRVWS